MKEDIVSPQEATQIQLAKPVSEIYVLSNAYPSEKNTDKFICKGKHQYREIKTECGDIYWTCQCGRKI